MLPVTRKVLRMSISNIISSFGLFYRPDMAIESASYEQVASAPKTALDKDGGRFPLSVRRLGKRYDSERQTLAGVDLEVNAGEFVVLVGPSGCGKSTLLRMVAGLESVSEGAILIGDHPQ